MKIINEIERKWLLSELPDIEFDYVVDITQYYSNGIRYRKEVIDGIVSFFKIEKKTISVGVNSETLHKTDVNEFNLNFPFGLKPIHKRRHVIIYDNHKFEVDVFDNHLVILEVELEKLTEFFNFQPDLFKVIIKEVTTEPRFSNYQLFKEWNNLKSRS